MVFTYDSRDQLTRTKRGPPGSETVLGEYDYNASGLRVRHRYSDRGDVDYYYDDNAVIEEHNATDDSILAHYRYADRLISLDTGTSVQYYHHDALGSTVNLTNDAGATQVSYKLDPWGHIRDQQGTSVNRQIFTQQEHDENTGLIYFGARYYDPDTARFITQDSYLGESNTPPSLHRYLYAYSNPTVYIDLYGYTALKEWIVDPADEMIEGQKAIVSEIQKDRDYDMAHGHIDQGFRYSAESVLMGLYGLALKGVRETVNAADFIIDLGRLNEFNENNETGKRTIDRIMAIDKAIDNATTGIKNIARQTKEDLSGTYNKVALAIGDSIIEHVEATYVRGEAEATATTTEFFGSIISGSAFAKGKTVKNTAEAAVEEINTQVKKKVKAKATVTVKKAESIVDEVTSAPKTGPKVKTVFEPQKNGPAGAYENSGYFRNSQLT